MELVKVTDDACKADENLRGYYASRHGNCDLCAERMRYVVVAKSRFVMGLCTACLGTFPGLLAAKVAFVIQPELMNLGGPHVVQMVRDKLMLNFNQSMADELSTQTASYGAESLKAFMHHLATHGAGPGAGVGMDMTNGKLTQFHDLNDMLKHMGAKMPKPKKTPPAPPPAPGPEPNLS